VSLRIGILGAARVATYALIAPSRDVSGVTLAGIAARDPARAADYAATHGIAETFVDYAALIASPAINAIYNALPPSLHARWSIAALEAGKPVLCEKPFALSLADVDAMLDAETRTGVLLMEAQHSHYHPLSVRMRDLCRSGAIGSIRHIDAQFDAPLSDDGHDLRYIPGVGGGALWDLGVYPAYWIRSVLGEEPIVVSASNKLHAGGADIATVADLAFEGGNARLSCNMQADFAARIRIDGTRGTLTIENPLAPQSGHRFALTVDDVTTEEAFPDRPTYSYQLEAFRDALAGGPLPATRGADTRATVALLAAIDAAARS
jgi:predicted dehydrogenase